MSEHIEKIESSIAAESSAAIKSSEHMLKLVKELKSSLMRRFLELEYIRDIYKAYSAGFTTYSGKSVRLRDLAAEDGIADGVNFKPCGHEQNNRCIPLLTEDNIKALRFDPTVKFYAEHDCSGRAGKCLIQSWDIIVRVDEKERGASAIVPMTDKEYLPGENVIRVRLDHSLCEAFYVLNIFHFYYNTGLMNSIIKSPYTESVSDIIIPLPPVEKQKQIADTMLQLSAAMNVQENYLSEMIKFHELVNNL